ncbi:MAG: fused MFS/spermidine synthase [Candidatus Omnitrophica bacterium]|nr:fused MFS/spermidine synthase [Candidatus Omnitrophota bacterium]
MNRRLVFSIILIGLTAMASQIVIMRELMVVFYGNELSLGVTLACWLFWVSFGSLVVGRPAAARIKEKVLAFSVVYIVSAFILPAVILCVRLIPEIYGLSPGEIVGVLPMLLSSFILLMPVCVLGGFAFTLGCETINFTGEQAGEIGYVYILEAIGASIGGIFTTFLFIRMLDPLSIMFFLALLDIVGAALLLYERKALFRISAILGLAFAFILFSGTASSINKISLKRQWKANNLKVSKDSIYGNIVITERDNVSSLFVNGLYSFSQADAKTHEMDAHIALLEHPAPKDVLLIGGSVGLLQEVLKHPIRRVDYVELDPDIIRVTKTYLDDNDILSDPRINVISGIDGRLYIKRTEKHYDVVIMVLPEPYTAQINRFYTVEFFKEISRLLDGAGILSFRLSSNPDYMSREQAGFYMTIKETLRAVFKDVKISPGATNYFLSSPREDTLVLDWRILMERLEERGIRTRYAREYYLKSEFSQERIESFNKRLASEREDAGKSLKRPYDLNRDFRPIAYYYDMILWSSQFNYGLGNFFSLLDRKRIYFTLSFIYAAICIPLLFKSVFRKIPHWGIMTCVCTSGFAEMSFQVVILISFQILYGYVYYKLGFIMTSYMIGLIAGAFFITKRLSALKDRYGLFIKTQYAIVVYPLILPMVIVAFAHLRGALNFWLGSNIVLPMLPIIAGFIGGFQFPLANKLYLNASKYKKGHAAGLTYGLDLLGAMLGAFALSLFLIPILGIFVSCLFVAGLNFLGLILLILGRNKI